MKLLLLLLCFYSIQSSFALDSLDAGIATATTEYQYQVAEVEVACVFAPNEENEGPVYHFYKSDKACLLYTSPSPRDRTRSRMPSSA